MQIFQYSSAMRILNTAHLPRGTGARYLEVSTAAPEGCLLAVGWRNAKPKRLDANRALVQFKR